MIPHPFAFLLLALGTYRLTRLVGWDTFPPIARTRSWVLGETYVIEVSDHGETRHHVEYSRPPLLIELFNCPFCLSVYTGLAVYLNWWAAPTETLVVCTVLALSAVTGLVARNLDA